MPRPFEQPLSPELAASILSVPLPDGVGGPTPRTVGERVALMRVAVDEANAYLAESPVAKIVARSLMTDLKKRGDATIVVRYDGVVVLRVAYGDEGLTVNPGDESAFVRRDVPSVRTVHSSDLPYLDELRKEAATLGVDVSHLGRARRAIAELLDAHRATARGSP